MRITRLLTNHYDRPLGFMLDPLNLSWITEEADGSIAEASRVEIALDSSFNKLVFDSGWDEKISSVSYLPDFKPEIMTKYFWRASVRSDAGDVGTSSATWFETGKQDIPLSGKWIKAPFEQHPIFFKTTDDIGKVKRARLYITGLGMYEAQINGKEVTDEILTPFYNDYRLWLQYQTYDVTSLMKEGSNKLSVMLGKGWYMGRFGFIGRLDKLYGDTMKFCCELQLTMADGTVKTVASDESWKCFPSPVLESSIYDGEEYDARLEGKGEEAAVYAVPAAYVDGRVQERMSPALRIMEKITPIELIHTPAGEDVLDFGQNMTGWLEFDCREPEGNEIFLQFGEILQNDNFYNENLRTAKEEFRYISNGNAAHVRPHFTFYGFRYVKVTGISNISLEDFKGCVIYSEMEQTGKIETSNEKVNRLFLNALWGQKGNFLDVPTDCPQRDERMGWTGDAQAFCATAMYNMYAPAFYDKYLYDMYLEQKELDGSVPYVVPDILGQIMRITDGNDGHDGSCGWGDAATIIPWTLYIFYGDRTMLERQYENMKAWTDYIKRIDDEKCGGSRLWTVGFHFADWLALDNYDHESSLGGTDTYFVASAYYFYSATLTAKAAKALGKVDEQQKYEKLASEIKAALQKEYFTPTGRIAIETQTALVLALCMGFAPEEHKQRVINDLKKRLDDRKVHLTTGFLGTSFLCRTLSENGLADYAYTLLLNEDYPSWLYEVNMGATTVWERWNSVLPNGMISDTGMNSLNHYAYGSVVEWMYAYICGLKPDEENAGFKHFTVSPQPDRRFDWAKMSFMSPYGEIRSAWEYIGNDICFKVKVPFDTSARFMLDVEGSEVYVNGEKSDILKETRQLELIKGSYEILVKDVKFY